MFTVIIAEKEHIDAITKENKLFFETFLESKDLAFCAWNPAGQTLGEAVPGLQDAVGRRKEWRTVIINPYTAESLKLRNPFDIVDYSALSGMETPSEKPALDEAWDEWEDSWKAYYQELTRVKADMYKRALEFPLQKLATWLCFKPEDYILNEVYEPQALNEMALESAEGNEIKPSLRLEMLEKYQYKVEMSVKENLRRDFVEYKYLNIAYPTEIHCISLRTMESSYFDPGIYWAVPKESDYSAFADRNMYFDKMRFMVFDRFPETHRDFRTDYIRFLASVLILASNPVPGSAMQARRLYLMETDTDDTPLCTLVTSYDRKLAATIEQIDDEMDRIRSEIPEALTDKVAEALFCTSKDIEVLPDESVDVDRIYVDDKYGLSSDCPVDEFDKWNSDYQVSDKELVYAFKQQSRAVRKSVVHMHNSSRVSDINIGRLTPYQMEDVREYTDACENDMVASIPPDLTDVTEHRQRLADQKDKIRKIIDCRMSRKTTIILGVVCLLVFALCWLPFMAGNYDGYTTISTASTLIGVTIGILIIAMFVSIFILRSKLVNAVKEYNAIVKETIETLQNSLKQVSKYLSAACNVRRGHAVQNYARDNMDSYTKSLRIRRKHQEDIRKKKAYLLEEYKDYLGGREFIDPVMSQPYDYDFDEKIDYQYPAPFLAGDSRQIEFISNGNYVAVPLSYVTRILVRMEGIYE